MSTSSIDCKTNHQKHSVHMRKLSFALAIVVSCAQWLGIRSDGQVSSGANHKTSSNTPGTNNPEEQVDIDYKETNLIPMTPSAPIPVLSAGEIDGGAIFRMRPGVMTVHFCNDNIVHVSYAPGNEPPADKSLAVIGCPEQYDRPLKLVETSKEISLSGDKLSVLVDRNSGALTFLTPAGDKILAEPQNGGKAMQKATVNQEDTY